MKQFRELQAQRLKREEQDREEAAGILNYCRSKQIPYDPADDGFVFTTAELNTWLRRRDRLDAVHLADIMDITPRPCDGGLPETSATSCAAA